MNLFVLYTFSVANIFTNLNSILILNGSYFKDRKENIFFVLGCKDLDLTLRIKRPTTPIDLSSSVDKMNYEKWKRSSRMTLMIIKHDIPEAFRGVVYEEITNAK